MVSLGPVATAAAIKKGEEEKWGRLGEGKDKNKDEDKKEKEKDKEEEKTKEEKKKRRNKEKKERKKAYYALYKSTSGIEKL